MTNQKFYIKSIGKDKNTGIEVTTLIRRDVMQKCKNCGSEDRKPGSAYGIRCSNGYKAKLHQEKRLLEKVGKQVGIIN